MAFALITVVRATRPTSGKPGDKAILTAAGEWLGWVGGSCAEPTARRAAAQALRDGECRLIHITNDEADLVRPGVEVAAMTCHSGGSLEIYVEPHLPRPSLIVFGRSPIALALCELGPLLSYRVVSADVPAGGAEQLAAVPGGRRIVVVASHGRQEVEALEWALRSPADYVGLVISRKRLPDVLERLRERGLTEAALERLHAPAGLSIGATEPGEVAVSILAEAVRERRAAESESESESELGLRSGSGSVGRVRRSCCDEGEEASGSVSSVRFSAVVLAAGLSRRMGPQNKLLLPVGGMPMIARVLQNVLGAGFGEVVVVLGHEAEAVRLALGPLGVRSVHNERFESGQVSSVRAGLAALEQPYDAVMICLGDQPLVTSADLRELQRAYERRPSGSILIPTRGGQRGNPVIIDGQSARDTLERGLNFGCRHFIDENPDRVYRWPAPSDHFVRDVDEPADYQTLLTLPTPPQLGS